MKYVFTCAEHEDFWGWRLKSQPGFDQKPEPCRNFWLEAEIDNPRGGKQILAGGPAGKDGGFTLKIKMRREGEYTEPLTITGRTSASGDLVLALIDGYGVVTERYATDRDKPKEGKP